jgi:predicted nucleic acid-binding protein
MNLVDTSGWIEYFFGERNASYFATPIEKTDQLVVPVICLYEVFKKVCVVADEARALRAVAQMKQGRVVDITEDVALSAALISLKHKLPMADSLIYATARALGATLWTQDDHFSSLTDVRYKEARTKP